MKILLPVDGSEVTKRMLGYVAAHDEMFGAGHDYLVVTVVPAIHPRVTSLLSADAIAEYQRGVAADVLRPVREFAAQNGWTVREAHVVGDPATSIAGLADKERPDLIVMGSHGHSALGGLILGSVASGVLARSKVPVLLIR